MSAGDRRGDPGRGRPRQAWVMKSDVIEAAPGSGTRTTWWRQMKQTAQSPGRRGHLAGPLHDAGVGERRKEQFYAIPDRAVAELVPETTRLVRQAAGQDRGAPEPAQGRHGRRLPSPGQHQEPRRRPAPDRRAVEALIFVEPAARYPAPVLTPDHWFHHRTQAGPPAPFADVKEELKRRSGRPLRGASASTSLRREAFVKITILPRS